MTQIEYDEKLNQIETTYNEAKKGLQIRFAMEARRFNIGDIISNGVFIIKVEKFGAFIWNKMPSPTYIGPELTKKHEPKKNGDRATIYDGSDVILIQAATV
jgi:hypothetical protein